MIFSVDPRLCLNRNTDDADKTDSHRYFVFNYSIPNFIDTSASTFIGLNSISIG